MLIIVTKYFTWSAAELSVFSSLQSVLIKSVVLYHKNVYSAVNVPQYVFQTNLKRNICKCLKDRFTFLSLS